MNGRRLLIALLLATATCCMGENSVEHEFIWTEANAKMTSARTKADFLVAAGTYRQLIECGVRNGPLYYNLGTALLEAGEHKEGRLYLGRAERYMGSTPDTRRNMRLAMALEAGEETASLPWHRAFLLWHYRLSTPSRITIALGALLVLCLATAMRPWTRHESIRYAMAIAVLTLVVFGSSALTSLHLERQDRDREGRSGAPPPALRGDAP